MRCVALLAVAIAGCAEQKPDPEAQVTTALLRVDEAKGERGVEINELAALGRLLPPVGSLKETRCPASLPPVTLHIRYETLVGFAACEGDAGALPAAPSKPGMLAGWNGNRPIRARADGCSPLAVPLPLPAGSEASLVIIRRLEAKPPVVTGTTYAPDGKTKESTFRSGSSDGEVFVIDRRSGTLACAARYHATSSDSFNRKAQETDFAVLSDMSNRVSSAIMATLTRMGAPHPDDLPSRD